MKGRMSGCHCRRVSLWLFAVDVVVCTNVRVGMKVHFDSVDSLGP